MKYSDPNSFVFLQECMINGEKWGSGIIILPRKKLYISFNKENEHFHIESDIFPMDKYVSCKSIVDCSSQQEAHRMLLKYGK